MRKLTDHSWPLRSVTPISPRHRSPSNEKPASRKIDRPPSLDTFVPLEAVRSAAIASSRLGAIRRSNVKFWNRVPACDGFRRSRSSPPSRQSFRLQTRACHPLGVAQTRTFLRAARAEVSAWVHNQWRRAPCTRLPSCSTSSRHPCCCLYPDPLGNLIQREIMSEAVLSQIGPSLGNTQLVRWDRPKLDRYVVVVWLAISDCVAFEKICLSKVSVLDRVRDLMRQQRHLPIWRAGQETVVQVDPIPQGDTGLSKIMFEDHRNLPAVKFVPVKSALQDGVSRIRDSPIFDERGLRARPRSRRRWLRWTSRPTLHRQLADAPLVLACHLRLRRRRHGRSLAPRRNRRVLVVRAS